MQRRHQPEDDAGQHGDGDGEDQHAIIDRDLARARDAVRADGDDQVYAPARQQQAQRAAGGRQQHALGQQLPDDAPAARAHGRADGHLFLPRSGARQQQVGDVGAGDQ